MKELKLEAAVAHLDKVLAFIDEELGAAGCPMKTQMQIDVVVEEVFVNVASYAYAPGTGDAAVAVELSNAPAGVTITVSDSGRPYNPLARQDPDITLPIEQREIGGLGVLMTKKLMDEVAYEYRDSQNILTLKKSW